MFEGMDLLRYAVVFVAILAVIGAGSFALRWIRIGSFGGAIAARGRQPRLGVTEFAAVGDGRRRLLLIRRDNVEHLVMTGGPTDVVIESNIARAGAAAPVRESAPARATPDALPRAVALAEANGTWPPQPEPIARPTRAAATAAREQRVPGTTPLPAEAPPRVVPERDGAAREGIREPVRETALRVQSADRGSGHAADLRNAEVPMVPPRRSAELRRAVAREEQNLAEMAQRLESALQRPRSVAEPPPVAPPPIMPLPRAVETVPAEPVLVRPEPESSEPSSEPTSEPKSVTKPKAAGAGAFDSLEQEMASLLGRPSGKT
jgi:hypothetical protein